MSRKMATYVVLTFGLSSFFYYRIISAGGLTASGFLVLGLMWCPGVAGMITQLVFQGSLKGMGWGWGMTRWQLWSYLLPLAYAGAVYLPVWFLGLGALDAERLKRAAERFGMSGLPEFAVVLVVLFIAGVLNLLPNCLSALGEEIGWRGFLVPELSKTTGFLGTAVWSGLIWAVWHYPLILFADYAGNTPKWYSLACFTLMVVGISFAMAWLRLRSGSLWTGMFFHASHNLFIQSVFDRLTVDTGPTVWIIGEFGIGLVVTGGLTGYLFWRKRRDLPERVLHAASIT